MIATLAAAVVSAWSYTGFLGDPAPRTTPPSPAPARPADHERPDAPKPAVPSIPPPEPPTPKASEASGPSRAPVEAPPGKKIATRPPAPPVQYQLFDATGQAWTHPDADYLRRFVEFRNRSLRIQTPLSYGATTCPGGRCR